MEIFGNRLVGVNAENGQTLLLTAAFLVVVYLLRWGLRALTSRVQRTGVTE